MVTRKKHYLDLTDMDQLPRELFVRQVTMPAQHGFPPHQHEWHQLLYAVSGVLVVNLEGERYFIPPEQAIWLPAGHQHSVYTEHGADLKSLYIQREYRGLSTERPQILQITPLVKELILSAATFPEHYPCHGYENDLVQLLLQSLPRLTHETHFLPWPSSLSLVSLCDELYRRPDKPHTTDALAAKLAISARTLDRRFQRETGMPLKHWRQQLRLMQAIEYLNTDYSITQIALELGYSAASPFIFMFRETMGVSPAEYRKRLKQRR